MFTDPRLICFLGVLMSSTAAVIARQSDAPALVIATWRLLFTVGLMAPFVLCSRREELRGLHLRDAALCAISGVFLAFHFTVWFESLKWTTVASSTVLVSTEVIFSALGFALFLKGKIPRLGIAGIALAFAGSALLTLTGRGGAGADALLGNLLALLGAVLIAVYTLIGRVLRARLSTMVYTFLTYSACLLTLLALDGVTATPLTGWGAGTLVAALLLAVLCTFLGHSVFSWCLKWLSPSYVSAVKLCGPVFAAVLAFFFFSEPVRPLQAAGAAGALLGALLYTRAEDGKKDAKQEKQDLQTIET